MAPQKDPQSQRGMAKPNEETRTLFEKARAWAQAVLAWAKTAARFRRKGEEAPAAEETKAEAGSPEWNLTALEEGAERRATFVVRLTADEHGVPRRTEVEHVQSGKKKNFPGLDVQRLADFMVACIRTANRLRRDGPPQPFRP